MAKTKKKQAKSKAAPKRAAKQAPNPTFAARSSKPRPGLGLICVMATMLLGVSLLDYDPSQSALVTTQAGSSEETRNLVGLVGANIASYGLRWFGMAIFVLPFYSAWLAYMAFFKHFQKVTAVKWIALLVAIIALASMGAMAQGVFENFDQQYFTDGLGGVIGSKLFESVMRDTIGPIGSIIILATLFILANGMLLHDNVASGSNLRGLRDAWIDYRQSAHENKMQREADKAERDARREEEAEKEAATAGKKAVNAPPPRGLVEIPGKGKPAEKKEPAKEKLKASDVLKRSANVPDVDPNEADLLEPADEIDVDFDALAGKGSSKKSNDKPKIDVGALDDEDDLPPTRLRKVSANEGGKRKPPPAMTDPAPKRKPAPPSEKGTLNTAAGETLPPAPAVQQTASGLKIVASEGTRKATQPLPSKKGKYIFPTMKLLQEPMAMDDMPTAADHEETANALVRTLEEFGVKVEMGEVHAGPVITRYDVFPAPGVRVEKIANLEKNIALSLKALSVRILAPVPGKGCVGIEVPNKKPLPVCIRDILESEDWASYKAEIPIALGKEVSGRPIMADLTKMPHLLIAGSTGSGKTVCINSVIASLLYHSSPDDLKFVMVDPKIVEMQVYNDLPHMMIPVVTDPKKVPGALKYLLKEMEKRYHLFASKGVRNIAGYNAKMAKIRDKEEAERVAQQAAEMDASLSPEERAALSTISVPRDDIDEDEVPEKLPYIVCIVDELADLMMVAPADIETGIARLAQLARAAGIHLILATQRPSVNVITGVIKANLPSRISFRVASKVDSRTILDAGGAESLIGKGDMLFLPPGSADFVRSQGAFVSDDEINGIVDYIKENNDPPEFDEQFQRSVEEGDEDEDGGNNIVDSDDQDSELVKKALQVIKTSKRASTSHLQRRLSIGYNRAARVMDKLEDAGIVGPDNGSSPREILVDLDEL